jgi:polysaccharide biosynthesis/export protein
MKFNQLIYLSAFSFFIFSCRTQYKAPNYLEGLNDSTAYTSYIIPELKIQKNDQLLIQVYSSSTKREADLPYNLPGEIGYLVDVNGNIEYPGIGAIIAEGLTKLQLADYIKKKLGEVDKVLTNPSVIIRWLNFKITFLGEVVRQGTITIPGETVNIIEAVGLAGGITDFGKKESIKIIRETDGRREVGTIDLSSKDVFSSRYYNLIQNDIVFVEPNKNKAKTADQIAFQRVTTVIGIVTSLTFLYTAIFK